MMRNSTAFFLTIVAVFMFYNIQAQQIVERVFIEGKVNVPIEDEASNINVINLTSKKGTVTNQIGEFTMFVAIGDEIKFSAIQFQSFTLKITEENLESKKLFVTLNEADNTLDEVIVRKGGLTGSIEVDAGRTEIKKEYVPIDMKKDPQKRPEFFTTDNKSPITKAVVDEQFVEHGLNVANIFRAIFKNKEKGDGIPEDLDVKIRRAYDDEFFYQYLNLEKNQINEFIFFVQDEKIDPELLKKENQLDFIQYLVVKSDEFRSRRD